MGNYHSLRAVRIFSRKDPFLYLIVFFSAIALKSVTELIAYPYPIGYDVINYYIPMLHNFETGWHTILRDYPFYTYVLHLIQNLTGLSVQTNISTVAILIFGLFAVSILSLGKAIVRNSNLFAVLITLFVLIQIPVLRTSLGFTQGHVLSYHDVFCNFDANTIKKKSPKHVPFSILSILPNIYSIISCL